MAAKRGRPAKEIDISKAKPYVRLMRVWVPNSHHAAFQMERIFILDEKVVKREMIGHPDALEMVLAKASECLDPESVINWGANGPEAA